jgi:endonuclease YncB( thermonuclease family)
MIRIAFVAALLGAALLLPRSGIAADGDAATSGSSRALPDLPEREVKPRPLHTVKEEAEAPARTPLDVHRSPAIESGQRTAAVAPRAAAPARPGSGLLSGNAVPTGATSLAIGGASVRLFGVRPPETRDRCGAAPCAELAQKLLAERVQRSKSLACQVPAQPGSAICRDKDGLDLASLLVGEGLAVADTRQSYDYIAAEASARKAKRGLWQYR